MLSQSEFISFNSKYFFTIANLRVWVEHLTCTVCGKPIKSVFGYKQEEGVFSTFFYVESTPRGVGSYKLPENKYRKLIPVWSGRTQKEESLFEELTPLAYNEKEQFQGFSGCSIFGASDCKVGVVVSTSIPKQINWHRLQEIEGYNPTATQWRNTHLMYALEWEKDSLLPVYVSTGESIHGSCDFSDAAFNATAKRLRKGCLRGFDYDRLRKQLVLPENFNIHFGYMNVGPLDYERTWYGGPNSGGWVTSFDFAHKEKEGNFLGVSWELWNIGHRYSNGSSFRHNYDEYDDTEDYTLVVNGTVHKTYATVSDDPRVLRLLELAGIPTTKKDFPERCNLRVSWDEKGIPEPWSQWYGGPNSGGNVGVSVSILYDGPEGKIKRSGGFNNSSFHNNIDETSDEIHIILK